MMTRRTRLPGSVLFFAIAFFLLLTFAVSPAFAQSEGDESEELQRGFSSLRLGMGFEAAQAALLTDTSFRYRGAPDVQFLPLSRIPIIETEGRAFVERAVLQFHEDTLYILSLLLDRARLDYFSVYEGLVGQYGDPTRLDPGQAVWESDRTRISLERPLTVKYMDLPTFEALVEEGKMEQALDEITRDRFLEQL